MGVPKLFRFLSERYPCLSEVLKEYEIHEYDNFYIDANGIIHNCSHPSDDVHFRISEEQIFRDIFYYLELLFRLIKPKKLFFIAIDGVAPRAKMNQQRSRRFRSAKDVENAIIEAQKKGEQLPDTERFDSNCITPGTVFMEKLHRQLQYFIKDKVTHDELWRRPKIILSGHNVPGEGEHKIMDYIRYMRSQPDWDPNTRHCLHGLDADLIMLGLCTHEPHFSLLREEVKFTKANSKKKTNIEETKFYLLHLSLMRDYLDLEFQELKKALPFEYDIERIIDDWVLMGFLVGNDFIPHLPHFHIANNALSLLYKAYIEILPSLDGYINNCGTLNLERFEKYLKKLAEVDFENFKDIQGDLKYFESKTGKKFPGTSKGSELDEELDSEVLALAKQTDLMLDFDEDESELSSDEEQLKEEFRVHKDDFYRYKLEYEKVDSETLREQTECYIRAIQWNLNYYYTGCPSWSWFYPHHYAPYVSDIKEFSGLDITFGPSKPFLPFQQLLAVLPAASKQLIPKPFQDLMTSPDSPIIKFYPTDFSTDLNGKKHDWEAVVLIPFIEENDLLTAMEPFYKDLTAEENMRNSIQPMEIYEYTSEDLGYWAAPNYFPPIRNNHAKVSFVSTFDVSLRQNEVVKGRLEGAISGAYLGFPHLGGIEFTAKLSPCKVKVFEHPSRGDNMILSIPYKEIDDEKIKTIANELLGEVVFVGWPHIQRGKVTAILTGKYQFRMVSGKVEMKEEKSMEFGLDSVEKCRSYKQTLGIDLQKVDTVVYVKTVADRRYVFEKNKAKLLYLWSQKSSPFPYQTLLRSAPLIEKDNDIGVEKDITEVISNGHQVFILSKDHYGSFGKVRNISSNGTVEVEIEIKPPLDLSDVLNLSLATDLKYFTGNVAAQRLGIGGHLFSRITGSIFIQNVENEEKLNAGLSLKFTKQGEEVAEFTKNDNNMWLYSEKTIALVDDYMNKFPELFEYLERHTGNDMFFSKDVFPENSKEKLHAIKQWLKTQPHNFAERRPFKSKLLTNEAMKDIEKRILLSGLDQVLSTKIVEVDPSKLHIPSENIGKAPPDLSVTIKLLDRVIFVRKNHCIPLGLSGTVVGYENPNPSEKTLYDILFDSPVRGGSCQSCDEPRIYRLTYQAFINISHGGRDAEQLIDFPALVENNFTNKREDWRKHCSKSSNHRSDKLPYSPSGDKNSNMQNIGNTKVKEFFDTYLNSGKVSSQPSGKIQTMVVSNSNSNDNVAATSEFHAMWNVLQGHSLNEDKPLRPQVPSMEPLAPTENSAAEQTNALRKLLKLSSTSSDGNQHSPVDLRPQVPPSQQPNIIPMNMPPAKVDTYSLPISHGNLTMQMPRSTKSCGHVSCCSDLVRLCANKNIAYPLFNYNKIPKTGDTSCSVVFFVDFGTVVGDPCKTKEEAAENAACKAIRHILLKDEIASIPLLPAGLGYMYPTSGMRPSATNLRIGMGPIPAPPAWWQTRRPIISVPDHHQQQQLLINNKRHSPRGMTHASMLQQKNLASSSSTSTEGSNCGDRVSSTQFKQENEKKEGLKTESQHQGGGSSKNSGHRSGSKKSGRGKSRPRIAANFSVPITDQ